MSQPWQLARAFKPRKSTKPILETLPSVNVNTFKISSLYTGKRVIIKPLRIPDIVAFKVSGTHVDFHLKSLHRGIAGSVQRFAVKPIRTGWGMRFAFVCNCGKGCIKLYFHNRSLMCGKCCNGRLASQALDQRNRPVLQASRIQNFLDTKSRIFRDTRERLRKRFGDKVMMAQSRMSTRARSNVWE
jgi:hypothetical protein